jgi:hypothetical protein
MKRSVRPPFLEPLEPCYSGVLDDPAIDELRGTVRGQDRDHAWNVIQDQAPIALALAQRFVVCGEFAESLNDPLKSDATALVIHRAAQSREIVGVRFEWRRVFRHGAGLPCVFAVSGVSAQGTS